MAVALSAIVVLALVVPGFLAWYGFRFDQKLGGVHTRPPFDNILLCCSLSVVFHCLWIPIAEYVASRRGNHVVVSGEDVLALVAGAYDEEDRPFPSIAADMAKHRHSIAAYLLSLYGFSYLSGVAIRLVILRLNLDARYRKFRIFHSEPWYELFVRARRRLTKKGEKTFTHVTFVMETSTGNFLYKGELRDYVLNQDRALDRILLRNVSRRMLPQTVEDCQNEAEREAESGFYKVEAEILVVDMSAVKNLAVFYFAVKDIDIPPSQRDANAPDATPPGTPPAAPQPPLFPHYVPPTDQAT